MKLKAMLPISKSMRLVPEDRATAAVNNYREMGMGEYVDVQPVNMHGQPTQGKKGSKEYLDAKVKGIEDRFGC